MSTTAITSASSAGMLPRCTVVIPDSNVIVPSWVVDLDSYRKWAWSDEFPQRGHFAYLHGDIWVDLSMEDFLTHSRVKAAFFSTIDRIVSDADIGELVPDGMLITNDEADIANEPDLFFFLWETMRSGRLKKVSTNGKCLELEGAPDIVLEVVSDSSVKKDKTVLREDYWKAGIPEYWLVDVRSGKLLFSILKHGKDGYVESKEAWQKSEILGHEFRLVEDVNPIGDPRIRVESR